MSFDVDFHKFGSSETQPYTQDLVCYFESLAKLSSSEGLWRLSEICGAMVLRTRILPEPPGWLLEHFQRLWGCSRRAPKWQNFVKFDSSEDLLRLSNASGRFWTACGELLEALGHILECLFNHFWSSWDPTGELFDHFCINFEVFWRPRERLRCDFLKNPKTFKNDIMYCKFKGPEAQKFIKK